MKERFRLQVSTEPDYDDVEVELLYGDDIVAILRKSDDQSLTVWICPPPGFVTRFDLDEFELWLGRARQRWDALGARRDS